MIEGSNTKQFLVLEASAGSGKTYALALRYVALLLEGGKVGEILALTFTNKAVDEMRQRVGDFLSLLGSQRLNKEEQKKQNELLVSLENEYGWQKEQVLKLAPSLLRSYWSQNPRISTLDSFFNAILRKFCWYVGVTHSFEIAQMDRAWIEEKFLLSLTRVQQEILIRLCLEHRKSLDEMLKMIEELCEHFLDCIIQDEGINKSLSPLKNKILELARELQDIVRKHPESSDRAKTAVDFNNFFELLEKGKTWIYKGAEYQDFKKLKLPEEPFANLREELLKYFILREREFVGFLGEIKILYQRARNAYSKLEGLLDFSDVTQKTYHLLTQEGVSDFFYFRLDDQISHILLDEFQDTSIVQYKILLPLIEEILSGNGRIGDRSFFVVGDKKQSIYQFRGGYGRLLDIVKALPSTYPEYLKTNYRSQSEIVEFVNEIFSPLFPSYVAQKNHKEGGYVKVYNPLHLEEDSKDAVFKEIHAQVQEFLDHGARLDEIAILAFKNEDVLRIGDYLKEHFSPISTKENVALVCKKDAQILLSSLKCSLSPSLLEKKRLTKLLGKKLEDEIEFLKFENESVGRYIYRAMCFYGLNSKVAKQVLEIACLSKNSEEFLKKIYSCKSSQEDQEGLKILTIHASKGLEFKHLIVLDRLSASSNKSDFFFCHYDEDLKGKIFVRSPQREQLDPSYAKLIEAERKEKDEERKNLLYVALTRACDSLVIMPIIKNRGKSEFEHIGLLQEGQNQFPKPRGSIQITQRFEEIRVFEKQVLQKNFGNQEGFIQKEKEVIKDYRSAKYGEIFHKALELGIGYEISSQSLLCFLKQHYGEWLNDGELSKILSITSKIKLALEQNFGAFRIQSEVSFIQNFRLYRIDSLLLCQNQNQELEKVIVLDYKTGGQRERDFEQVQSYVRFVKTQYIQVDVQGYLLYLNDSKFVRVE